MTFPIVTDDGFAGALEVLNLMVSVSAVGGFASKVTPSTVSVEVLLILDELRVAMVAVRLAATVSPSSAWTGAGGQLKAPAGPAPGVIPSLMK